MLSFFSFKKSIAQRIQLIAGTDTGIEYQLMRKGEIPNTVQNIDIIPARITLGFDVKISFIEGLEKTLPFYEKEYQEELQK